MDQPLTLLLIGVSWSRDPKNRGRWPRRGLQRWIKGASAWESRYHVESGEHLWTFRGIRRGGAINAVVHRHPQSPLRTPSPPHPFSSARVSPSTRRDPPIKPPRQKTRILQINRTTSRGDCGETSPPRISYLSNFKPGAECVQAKWNPRWNSCSSSIFRNSLFPPRNNPTNSARLESTTFKHSNNLTSGREKERKIEKTPGEKSRRPKGGRSFSTRRWEVGQKSSDESDLLWDYGAGSENGESVNWTERWRREKGRRSKGAGRKERTDSFPRVSLFPLSFLSLVFGAAFSLSLYVYRCIHIRTSFEIFLRSILVDASIDTVQGNPISAYTSAEIVAPFDRWNHLESSPVEIGWFLPGEEGRIFLVVIRGFARCPSLFDSKHGGAHMGVGRMQRLPPRLKQIFTEQLFTQRSETATKCTDINSISHPRSKDTPFVNRYRIIPSVSLSRNFDPDLNNNALIKICRKQIFPTRRWTRNTPSFYFLSFLSLSPPSRTSS